MELDCSGFSKVGTTLPTNVVASGQPTANISSSNRAGKSERLQLTYPPMYPVLPRWSPDGTKIIFFEFARNTSPARIYEVSAGGGSPRELLPNDHSQQLDPNWSPDGSKIIFAGESNSPASSIRILDLATDQLSTLPASQGLYSPRW